MAIAMRKSERNKKNTDHRTPFSEGGIADQNAVYSPVLEFLQGLFSIYMIVFIEEQYQKERPEITLRPSVFGFKSAQCPAKTASINKATIFVILIIGFTAGPAVSL